MMVLGGASHTSQHRRRPVLVVTPVSLRCAGEAIAGPYVWGRYDLLLLPPSFP